MQVKITAQIIGTGSKLYYVVCEDPKENCLVAAYNTAHAEDQFYANKLELKVFSCVPEEIGVINR